MQNCPQKAFEKIRSNVLSIFPDQLITIYRKSSEGGNIILKHVDMGKKIGVVVDTGLYCTPSGDIAFIRKEIGIAVESHILKRTVMEFKGTPYHHFEGNSFLRKLEILRELINNHVTNCSYCGSQLVPCHNFKSNGKNTQYVSLNCPHCQRVAKFSNDKTTRLPLVKMLKKR